MTCAQLKFQPKSSQTPLKFEALLCKVGYFNYFANVSSNEKVLETKVVDLEKLNKNGIKKLFIGGQEEGENFNLPISP